MVIPVLDDAELLRTGLAALGAQTRRADVVLVVDNGSTDASAQVARDAGARVVDEPQRGILAATVRGFDTALAAGVDVIARIDADSVPAPGWLARVERDFTEAAAAGEPLTAVTGPATFYGGSALTRFFGRRVYLAAYFTTMHAALGHTPLFGSNFALWAAVWPQLRPGVHLGVDGIHDDLDISYRIRPGMRVRFDRGLEVRVSARPFDTASGFVRRVHWGVRTLWINGRRSNPVARIWARSRS